jgi:His/Glu/Gln/Arg/opine family amino acid ABC transporter permease subunit
MLLKGRIFWMTISWSNITRLLNYSNMFQQGLIVTVLLALCTVFFGFFLAFALALMLLSDVRPLRHLEKIKTDDMERKKLLDFIARFNPVKFIASAYVQFVRCTPMLVQIFLVYYIVFGCITLPKFTFLGFIQFERFFPAAVALALNSGGYMSAVIRGGIEGVDGGQTEAARSLGMSKGQTMYHIILPQAVKNILPSLANEYIAMIKETSLAGTFMLYELMYTRTLLANKFFVWQPLFIMAIIYLVMTVVLSGLVRLLERRLSAGDKN